jgi:hypothetical protein
LIFGSVGIVFTLAQVVRSGGWKGETAFDPFEETAMKVTISCVFVGLIGLSAGGPAVAQDSGRVPAATRPSSIENAVQTFPEDELKRLYMQCGRETERRLLAGSEVMACSVVYETLLARVFGGDFLALIAWSRSASRDRPLKAEKSDGRD